MIVFPGNFRYAGGMNISLDLTPPQMAIVIVPHRETRLLLELAAELAARGPLLVLDGGNRFNAYPVARRLRGSQALENLRLARAFTCFQMLALLQSTESDGSALLVLDPLATFSDENVPASERKFTFRRCVAELIRLSRRRILGIGLLDRPDPLGLVDYLTVQASRPGEGKADNCRAGNCRIYRLEEPPAAAPLQPRLI